MNPKQLSKYHGIVRLDDWAGLDRTGATDMSSRVQAWQDQAFADKRVAVAPPGIFGLNTKVLFKAPTVGAGGAAFGRPDNTTAPVAHTTFKNLAINDNSWMIDVITSSVGVDEQYAFGLLKGFRCHSGGLNCSLMRVRGVESVPAGFALEKFLWDDIIGYGGWVNFEHYGYGGEIRNVYSRAARLSAFRAYLSNAVRVSGGWFGVANNTAWEFEVFVRATSGYLTETAGGIEFAQTVFQSQDASSLGNGLRISERIRAVTLRTYWEAHQGSGGNGGVSLQVGWNKGDHESPAIPTAVDITGADAPTNDPRYAALGIDLSGCSGAGATTLVSPTGPRFMFNNVKGINWGRNSTIFGRFAEYTKYTRDINEVQPLVSTGISSLSSINGVNPIAGGSAGATVISVAADPITQFGVGEPVFLSMTGITGRNNIHETTVQALDSVGPDFSVTLTDAVPAGRAFTTSDILCRNRANRWYTSLVVKDPLNRGNELVNLFPVGNFIGSVIHATNCGSIHGVKEAKCIISGGGAIVDDRMRVSSDATVRRNGRPTLKITRRGSVVGGSQVARLVLYPWGNEAFIQTGVPIVVSGWYMMENVAPYSSTDFSANSTWDSPMVGLVFTNAVGEVYTPTSAAFTLASGFEGSYPVPGHWYQFLYEVVLNDPGVTKIGINILPSNANGYNWTTDASVWFDSLGLFVNPRSYQDIAAGRYSHNPAAGHFDASGKFEVTGVVPSIAGVQLEIGDRFWEPAPATGVTPGWVVTLTGNGATALNHCPMAVLGAAI